MFSSLDPIVPTHSERAKIVVFASGSGTNFENIVQATTDGRLHADVIALVTNKKRAGAIARAERLQIPVHIMPSARTKDRRLYDQSLVDLFTDVDLDLVVFAGWMRLVTDVFLDAFADRVVNIHPSLLPSFKGVSGIDDAFEAGVALTGCTVHIVTQEMDDGPIVGQCAVRIAKTLDETAKRVHDAEYLLYPRAIQKVLNYRFAEKRM